MFQYVSCPIWQKLTILETCMIEACSAIACLFRDTGFYVQRSVKTYASLFVLTIRCMCQINLFWLHQNWRWQTTVIYPRCGLQWLSCLHHRIMHPRQATQYDCSLVSSWCWWYWYQFLVISSFATLYTENPPCARVSTCYLPTWHYRIFCFP